MARLAPALRALVLALVFACFAATAAGQAKTTARAPWWDRAPERKIGQYWIKTDLEPDRANELAVHLNLMYGQYAQRLASLPQRAPERLNVMIFRERREYLDVLRVRFGVNAAGTGGIFFVNQLGTALAFWTEGLSKQQVHHVLQHEGFHQFAWSRFGGDLPPWTNEGLAEFFGEAALVGGRLVIGQSKPRVIDTVKDAIEREVTIPFRDMLTMDSARWRAALHDGTAAIQYHQAWSMVHFLVYGEQGRFVEGFENYLRLLNSGVAYEQAFVRSFGGDPAVIDDFEARWKAYALSARPSAFVTALERIEFLAEGARELSRLGIVSESLEQLREQLTAIGFTRTISIHGVETVLAASDEDLFRIPMDELATEQPLFVVAKPKLRGLAGRRKRQEEERPTPPSIATRHLAPRGLSVRWRRDRETGAFSYEIVVR